MKWNINRNEDKSLFAIQSTLCCRLKLKQVASRVTKFVKGRIFPQCLRCENNHQGEQNPEEETYTMTRPKASVTYKTEITFGGSIAVGAPDPGSQRVPDVPDLSLAWLFQSMTEEMPFNFVHVKNVWVLFDICFSLGECIHFAHVT